MTVNAKQRLHLMKPRHMPIHMHDRSTTTAGRGRGRYAHISTLTATLYLVTTAPALRLRSAPKALVRQCTHPLNGLLAPSLHCIRMPFTADALPMIASSGVKTHSDV